MSLADVHHQPHAQRQIQRAVGGGRLPHALIFHGPDGVGKEAFAVALGQALLCPAAEERDVPPEHRPAVGVDRVFAGCGKCEDCRAVTSRSHPDLNLIYRQLNREHPDATVRRRKALDIGVDVLRHFLIDRAGLTAQRGRYKVFIVREADRMTTAAQNALLKTLEEPPGDTLIVLLVQSVGGLLPTTQSRCQAVRFDSLPLEFVRDRLRAARPELSPEATEWYARISDGSIGGAIEKADDGLLEINGSLLGGMNGRGSSSSRAALALGFEDLPKQLGELYRKRDPDITDTEATRRGLQTLLMLLSTWYADQLRVLSGEKTTIVNQDRLAALEKATGNGHLHRPADAIRRISRAERQLDLNLNTQLVIETLLNDLVRTDAQ